MLNQYSTEALLAEIAKRKKLEENKPKPLNSPNFDKLIEACELFIENLSSGRVDEDDRNFIFEEAISAVYGNVWKWINERQ